MTPTPPPWLATLQAMRSPFSNEAAMQEAVASLLPPDTLKEHRFDAANRIDFLAVHEGHRYGIECKTSPKGETTVAQLTRYALHVDTLILLTTKPFNLRYPLKVLAGNGKTVPLVIIETWRNL